LIPLFLFVRNVPITSGAYSCVRATLKKYNNIQGRISP
jgi:hypothetical protein